MAIVQLGTASVQGDVDDRSRAMLAVVYSSGLTSSQQKLMFKGIPLTLYDAGQGQYSLAVLAESDVDAISAASPTTSWSGQAYVLGRKSAKNFVHVVEKTAEQKTPAGTVQFRGMPLAVNSKKSLVLTKVVAASYDQECPIPFGNNSVTVRRVGANWYLVVSEE